MTKPQDINMQRIPSIGGDFTDRDIAQVIERAKLARVQHLHDHHGRALKAIGSSAMACGLAFLVVVGAGSPRHQVAENTAVIERLATKLARAEVIPAKTTEEISQLLRRPEYDCRQIACEPWLEKRNLAARSKLQMILARTTLQADAAGK
jgi:hypothetical protein